MQQTRRTWLRTTGAALAGVALAGCSGSDDDGDEPEEEPSNEPDEQPSEDDDEETTEPEQSFEAVDVGVASEWNAMRTRLRDPVILGHAGEFQAGAGVAQSIFERFEEASGEYNAHEMLEETDEEAYESFEDALGSLRAALEDEDLEAAHEAMRSADEPLRTAQTTLLEMESAMPLSMLVMGAHVADIAVLVAAGDYADAEQEFTHIGDRFEESGMADMLSETDAGEQFATALEAGATAASEEDAEAAMTAANDAFDAAVSGARSVLPDGVTDAAHVAALQGRGWDAGAVASFGGPSLSFAHAGTLNDHRALAQDARTLYHHGESDAAVALVQQGLERFETARAHDALEEADHEAYESFEGGLEALATAIQNDDAEGVDQAAADVETALQSGIGALTSGNQAALLESGYAKIRIEDAVELYRLGDSDRALATAQSVFEAFESNAGDFHETLEETDEALYDAFEHEHLEGLIEAFEAGEDDAVDEHVSGIRETLLSFETAVGSNAAVGVVQSGYVSARGRDAVVLATLGADERAAAVATAGFQFFESNAGDFHETLEEADHDTYEAFEEPLESLGERLSSGVSAARPLAEQAANAAYAVVEGAAAGNSETGAAVLQSVFEHFETAAVHDALEEADSEAYETFESRLEDAISAAQSGSGVGGSVEGFADASLRAQFAVAGAPDEAPVDAEPAEDGDDGESDLEGGPNIQDGVPEDADHVVEMQAVAFEPETVTVSVGDTVAWEHAGGEPHNVVAYEGQIPEDAEYWASGGFDSEQAAREGWENGEGAVQSGQSYVHTFETPGEHEYFCVPHEAAGMVGTVVVEE